jgi:hypothetical protein
MPFSVKRYGTRKKWTKYKSCVKKVKKKGTAVNPYAVCRKSVYKTPEVETHTWAGDNKL